MFIDTAPKVRLQACATNNEVARVTPSQLTLYAATALLGGASLTLATSYGIARGADLASSAIWGATGLAVGLICLVAPRLMRAGSPRTILAPLYALALAFAIAGALGTAAGGRQHVAAMDAADAATSARATEAYSAAKAALAKLPYARPAAVIEVELAAVLNDARLNGCTGWLESSKLRAVCVQKVEPASAELATANERARLDGIMRAADARLTEQQPAAPANSDAATLARYLTAVGVAVSADTVADWLVILAVLVLEIGPGLALAAVGGAHHGQPVIVAAAAESRSVTQAATPAAGSALLVTPAPPPSPTPAVQAPRGRPQSHGPIAVVERLKADIASRLAAGPVRSSHRRMAESLGTSHGSLQRALRELEASGRLRATADKSGTRLELVT